MVRAWVPEVRVKHTPHARHTHVAQCAAQKTTKNSSFLGKRIKMLSNHFTVAFVPRKLAQHGFVRCHRGFNHIAQT